MQQKQVIHPIQIRVRREGRRFGRASSLTIEMPPSAWRVRSQEELACSDRDLRDRHLPPTPSMQSLHKPKPVFPPHMASIGGSCCCCCVCSYRKQKNKTARRSSANLIMKSVTGSWHCRLVVVILVVNYFSLTICVHASIGGKYY